MKHRFEQRKRAEQTARLAALVLLGALGALLLAVNSGIANAMGLKQQSVVESDTLTLGDIFYDLPRDQDRVLGLAPRPGQEMVLNARTLLRIALALDLPWRPRDAAEQVVVRRAATIVPAEQLESAIRASLEENGIKGRYNLLFADGKPEIVLPQDQPANAEIESVTLDTRRTKFEIAIAAPSKANPVQRRIVSGTIEPLVSIPVLLNPLGKGDLIGERDIEMIEIRASDLGDNMVVDAGKLAGMTPRRMITPGKPIKANEIEAPELVSRGENVTMIYREGSLVLTAQGKALENGAKGDTIRVVNIASSQTLQAFVSNDKEVTVAMNAPTTITQ